MIVVSPIIRYRRRAPVRYYWVGMSSKFYRRDRAHGAGLPATLSDRSYDRLRGRFASRTAAINAGYAPIEGQPNLYRKAHQVWTLNPADDGDGYVLVRQREERAVDLRPQVGDRVAFRRQGQLADAMVVLINPTTEVADLLTDDGEHETEVPLDQLMEPMDPDPIMVIELAPDGASNDPFPRSVTALSADDAMMPNAYIFTRQPFQSATGVTVPAGIAYELVRNDFRRGLSILQPTEGGTQLAVQQDEISDHFELVPAAANEPPRPERSEDEIQQIRDKWLSTDAPGGFVEFHDEPAAPPASTVVTRPIK